MPLRVARSQVGVEVVAFLVRKKGPTSRLATSERGSIAVSQFHGVSLDEAVIVGCSSVGGGHFLRVNTPS